MFLTHVPVTSDLKHYPQVDVMIDDGATSFRAHAVGERKVSCD